MSVAHGLEESCILGKTWLDPFFLFRTMKRILQQACWDKRSQDTMHLWQYLMPFHSQMSKYVATVFCRLKISCTPCMLVFFVFNFTLVTLPTSFFSMIHLQNIVLRRLLSGKMNTKLAAGRWSSPLSVLTRLQMVNFSFSLCLPHFPQFFMGQSLWHPSMTASGFASSFAVQPFDHTAILATQWCPCG